MEPHCQSVLTPPPPFCQAVTQLSLDALEPLSQFVREGGRVYVCVCMCVSDGVYERLRRDDEIRSLGACVFSVFVCRIKAALVPQRHPGPSTDCSPTYSSHLM